MQKEIHKCHHPDCDKSVNPSMWGCNEHWQQVPIELRTNLKKAYRIGQEVDKRPSRDYLTAAYAIRIHIRNIKTNAK
jgi:hypothetical protein